MIRAIDLCAGAGGWVCAARGLDVEIVLAVDLWDVACKTYEINNPGTRVVQGDLRDPEIRELVGSYAGQVDLVLGGIPCEWISVYRNVAGGVSEPEKARERETLDSVLDLLKVLSPRWWCLEDVRGLVKQLPIFTPWVEIDAAEYSGQRRKRIYVGEFPAPRARASSKLLGDYLRPGPYRIGKRTWLSEVVTSSAFAADKCHGLREERKSLTVCCWSSRRDKEVAVIDDRLPGGKRQVEWQEAARLQGFPEDYLFYGPPSDVWTMIGRAVQIDTCRAILEAIVKEKAAAGIPAEFQSANRA